MSYKNNEGYPDPTAGKAVRSAGRMPTHIYNAFCVLNNTAGLLGFQMSYRYDPDTVIDTYKRFKGMDGEDIIENRVKTVLKSKISEITTDYSMMDIYSGNRSELNNAITEYLNKDFHKKYGVEVLDASIVDVHPDKKLKQAIDNRVTALQEKQQAQAEHVYLLVPLFMI